MIGSIHSVAKTLMNGASVNGWDVWFYKGADGKKIVIDELREKLRTNTLSPAKRPREGIKGRGTG